MRKLIKNGNSAGLASGLFWGLGTVLIGMALGSKVFASLGDNASLVTTFLHDSVSFGLLLILVVLMKHGQTLKRVLFSKSGLVIIGAALLGGPIGMGAYIQSIRYLGPSLASGISAAYPTFGVLLGYLFLKERLKLRNLIAILISVVAIVLMGSTSGGSIPNLGVGILFALICVVGWGSEAVIIGYALKEDVPSEIALVIRQGVSSLTYGFVVMPMIGYGLVGNVMSQSNVLIPIVIAGLMGTISYLCYYFSIGEIGPSRAMGLNISYPAWAFVFQFLIDGSFDGRSFVFVVIIFMGSILTAEDPSDLFPFLKKKDNEPSV